MLQHFLFNLQMQLKKGLRVKENVFLSFHDSNSLLLFDAAVKIILLKYLTI